MLRNGFTTAGQLFESNGLAILQSQKKQLQRQLNIQIGKFAALQLECNEKTKLINTNNAKYNTLSFKFKQAMLMNTKHQNQLAKYQQDITQLQNYSKLIAQQHKHCQSKSDLLKQEYCNDISSWRSKYNVLYEQFNCSKIKYKQLDIDYQINNKKWKSKYTLLQTEYKQFYNNQTNKYNQLNKIYLANHTSWKNKYNLLQNEKNQYVQHNNHWNIQHQTLQTQFNDLNEKYTVENQKWITIYKNHIQERSTLQNHIRKLESDLKQLKQKYKKFVPEKPITNTSPHSSTTQYNTCIIRH
eukprot:3081_1